MLKRGIANIFFISAFISAIYIDVIATLYFK